MRIVIVAENMHALIKLFKMVEMMTRMNVIELMLTVVLDAVRSAAKMAWGYFEKKRQQMLLQTAVM